MTFERTLTIIKPDGVARNLIGEIYHRFETAGLELVAAKMLHMTCDQAQAFFAHLSGKSFYPKMVQYMISGPMLVQVLESDDTIRKTRKLMGVMDPRRAAKGTIRADLSHGIHRDVVYCSDSLERAKSDIAFFFNYDELCLRTR